MEKAMNSQTQLAVSTVSATTAIQPYFPTDQDWKMMLSWGSSALKSGMLPSAIRTAEAAAIIALKGRELGIPFMQAVAHIHVINGKPSMSAEMLQALARRNLPGLVINILESSSEAASVEFIRPEKGSKPYVSSFTMLDAGRAKLNNKDVWKQYPAAMLWSRAVSAGLRKVCPEALMGVSYTPEELGKEVDQDGNVIETTSRNVDNNADLKSLNDVAGVASEVIQIVPREIPDTKRDELNAVIAKLFKPFMAASMKDDADFKFRQFLKNRWKYEEIGKLSLEEVEALIVVMQDKINGTKSPAIKPILQPDSIPQEVKPQAPVEGPTDAQLKRFFAIQRDCGLDDKAVKKYLFETYEYSSRHDLNPQQYNDVVAWMESYKVKSNPPTVENWQEAVALDYGSVK